MEVLKITEKIIRVNRWSVFEQLGPDQKPEGSNKINRIKITQLVVPLIRASTS